MYRPDRVKKQRGSPRVPTQRKDVLEKLDVRQDVRAMAHKFYCSPPLFTSHLFFVDRNDHELGRQNSIRRR